MGSTRDYFLPIRTNSDFVELIGFTQVASPFAAPDHQPSMPVQLLEQEVCDRVDLAKGDRNLGRRDKVHPIWGGSRSHPNGSHQ
jgi:hypothetical protein